MIQDFRGALNKKAPHVPQAASKVTPDMGRCRTEGNLMYRLTPVFGVEPTTNGNTNTALVSIDFVRQTETTRKAGTLYFLGIPAFPSPRERKMWGE